MINKSDIEAAIAHYHDIYLGQDLVSAKAIKTIDLIDHSVRIDISLGFFAPGHDENIKKEMIAHVKKAFPTLNVVVNVASTIIAHRVQPGLKIQGNIKNIIAVASGKGGVGKSTTAVNLALALASDGARVGILDADIYGPSQPHMLGATPRPYVENPEQLQPVICHGLQTMSIGYLVDQQAAMVWRGPMVSGALQQLLRDTAWKDLDYLVIDLPPGTGDIQLTMAQKIPVSGAIIVTTPQDIALLDARRAITMFQKVNVPVLGVVENMSAHICSHCGHREAIFGEGGGDSLAAQYHVPLLGQLPLDLRIRQQTDGGAPTVIAEPNGELAQLYREISRKVAARLSLQAKNPVNKFPNIVIENT